MRSCHSQKRDSRISFTKETYERKVCGRCKSAEIYCRKEIAKKRWIDVLIATQNSVKRIFETFQGPAKQEKDCETVKWEVYEGDHRFVQGCEWSRICAPYVRCGPIWCHWVNQDVTDKIGCPRKKTRKWFAIVKRYVGEVLPIWARVGQFRSHEHLIYTTKVKTDEARAKFFDGPKRKNCRKEKYS